MKFKRLIPALAMLLVSAILLGTSTFAWFSMNTQVTATDMEVKAVAEDGIVIAAYTNNTTAPTADMFTNSDATEATAVTEMHPTFTSTFTTWYHAASTETANGQAYNAEEGYAAVTNGTEIYYQENKFQIKSTGSAQAVYVKSITVTDNDDGTFDAYSSALRVGISTGDATLIFAPVGTHSGAALTETINAALNTSDDLANNESVTLLVASNYNTADAKVLDDVAATPEDVTIFIYFDGEDAACKSDNIPATVFEDLEISVTFTTTIS